MLDQRLLATVNSDDPAYFEAYVNENFAAVAGHGGLTTDHLIQLARNSFEIAWLARRRARGLSRLDRLLCRRALSRHSPDQARALAGGRMRKPANVSRRAVLVLGRRPANPVLRQAKRTAKAEGHAAIVVANRGSSKATARPEIDSTPIGWPGTVASLLSLTEGHPLRVRPSGSSWMRVGIAGGMPFQ